MWRNQLSVVERLLLPLACISHLCNGLCHIPQDNHRFDCFPGPGANESACVARGCCWNDALAESNPEVPMCYFPRDFLPYSVTRVIKISGGYEYTLERSEQSYLPNEILRLNVAITSITPFISRVRITDPAEERFEVPYVYESTDVLDDETRSNLEVKVTNPFSIKITNKLTGKIIVDTSVAPLLYSDQFIQISTSMPSYFVYGLGEHRNPLRVTSSWQKLAFWSRDQAPQTKMNLYGTNPFALFLDDDADASGIFFLNANAMEAQLQPAPAVTFRTIGGVIDMFVYGGLTSEDVVRQHWQIVGAPYFQPLWAMGFHLSRYGYKDIDDLRNVMARMNSTNFPYDTQWTDIDAMRNRLVFTYDTVNWSGLPDLVRDLHSRDMFYVPINDPCIGSNEPSGSYPALDSGLRQDIFIKHPDNSLLTARVWPGDCYMPDFTHPNAMSWWVNEIRAFNASAPFDGLWIDMNEPASFVAGSVNGCLDPSLDEPFYVPNVGDRSLIAKTICPSARQFLGTQYDLHNMYGSIEAKVSYEALQELDPNRRHFILTRSHFAGVGKWAAHWSGDNYARWDDLYYNIPEAIVNNMFGIPFYGADICGFFEDTSEELCTRWMQLGAFMPFMRNHNGIDYVPQDPAIWPEAARSVMKQALMLRYQLIPFWYTRHYQAAKNLITVIQPLFYLYPHDPVARWLDTQFMIGHSIMVAPVLIEGAKVMTVYLPPEDTWYTYPDLQLVEQSGMVHLPVLPDTLALYVRAGSIIPIISNIDQSKNLLQNVKIANFAIQVTAPQDSEEVRGSLYWDNGLSLIDTGNTVIDILLQGNSLTIMKQKIDFERPMFLSNVTIAFPHSVAVQYCTMNGISVVCTMDANKLVIETYTQTNLNSADPIRFEWTSAEAKMSSKEL